MSYPNPAITFQVNLEPDLIGLLHPDRHQTNQDTAQAAADDRKNHFSTWLPTHLQCSNIVVKDDGTFTAYGQEALRLATLHTTGTRPLLTVLSKVWQ